MRHSYGQNEPGKGLRIGFRLVVILFLLFYFDTVSIKGNTFFTLKIFTNAKRKLNLGTNETAIT